MAVTEWWFGCIFREREATEEPQAQVLCIAHVLHAWLPRAQRKSSLCRHSGWFCKCMLGPMGTMQPRKCLLEAGGEGLLFALQSARLLEKRCRQLRRYCWSLGVVAKLRRKIQDLRLWVLKPLQGNLKTLRSPGLGHHGAAPLHREGEGGTASWL